MGKQKDKKKKEERGWEQKRTLEKRSGQRRWEGPEQRKGAAGEQGQQKDLLSGYLCGFSSGIRSAEWVCPDEQSAMLEVKMEPQNHP